MEVSAHFRGTSNLSLILANPTLYLHQKLFFNYGTSTLPFLFLSPKGKLVLVRRLVCTPSALTLTRKGDWRAGASLNLLTVSMSVLVVKTSSLSTSMNSCCLCAGPGSYDGITRGRAAGALSCFISTTTSTMIISLMMLLSCFFGLLIIAVDVVLLSPSRTGLRAVV